MMTFAVITTILWTSLRLFIFFFFNDTATTEIYTLSLHDALPISILTVDPLSEIKKLLHEIPDQKYRYLGGAVGIINYDAIRLWEKIPDLHKKEDSPLMEFGIYTDGILYDNKEKKSFYFYYEKNRIDNIIFSEPEFEKFSSSEVSENLDKQQFEKMVEKAK